MSTTVKFEVNKHNPNGEFYLTFPKEPVVRFFGREMTALQRFRRYGNLPDNGVAANKIINKLGQHLLSMEVMGSKIKSDKKFKLHRIEKVGNALYIDIFCELAKLEKGRLSGEYDLDQLKENIEKIFNDYKQYLKDTLKTDLLSARLDECKTNLLENLNTLKKGNYELRRLFQSAINDYGTIQQEISFLQRPFLGVTEMANGSLTEAYNDAFYELEAHKFGNFVPDDKQLWLDDEGLLSTEEIPELRKDRALQTASLDDGGNFIPTIFAPSNYEKYQKEIKDSNLNFKKAKKVQENEKPEDANQQKQEIDSLKAFYDSIEATKPADDASHPTHLHERPVMYFEDNDLFSAIGTASLSVGKYFEREVGAKHPLISLGFFLTASITFMAAGLSSLSVAPALMNKIVLGVSKVLSLGGHAGSPEKIANIINQVSAEWLHLCHTDGKLVETLIMNGMGLPKFTFVGLDTFLNGLEDKDSLTMLIEKLTPPNLTGELRHEEVKRITKNIFAATVLFSVAIGAGLTSQYLLTKKGIWETIGGIINKFTGVSSSVFTDLVDATTAAEKLQAIIALVLTVKTAGLVIGKVGLVFESMKLQTGATKQETIEFEDQQNAVCMMELLLCLKSSSPQHYQSFINQRKLGSSIIDNFNKACKNYPEIRQKFAQQQEFLDDWGIKVDNPSSLALKLVGGLCGIVVGIFLTLVYDFFPGLEPKLRSKAEQSDFYSGMYTSAKTISDQFLGPIWGILYLAIGLFAFILNPLIDGLFDKVRNTKGFADGLKLLQGLFAILLFFYIPVKMIFVGVFELVKRVCMFLVNFVAKVKMLFNALFEGGFIAGVSSLLWDLVGLPSFLIDQTIGALIVLSKFILNTPMYLWNIMVGAFYSVYAFFNGLFGAKSFGAGFFEIFDDNWKGLIEITGALATRREYLDEYSLFLYCKDKSADNEFEMIEALRDSKYFGVEEDLKFRQEFLGKVHDFFSSVAKPFSLASTYARTITLRQVQETRQDIEFIRLGHTSTEQIISAVGQNKLPDSPSPKSQANSSNLFSHDSSSTDLNKTEVNNAPKKE